MHFWLIKKVRVQFRLLKKGRVQFWLSIKGQSEVPSKKRKTWTLNILKGTFLIFKGIFKLKVYGIICKQTSKKGNPFSLFLLKDKEGVIFLNEGQQGHYSFYEWAGRAQKPSETVWGNSEVNQTIYFGIKSENVNCAMFHCFLITKILGEEWYI